MMAGRHWRILAVGLAAIAGACQAPRAQQRASDLRGTVLDDPIPKIDFTLTRTDGTPFSFRKETEGYLTLLFFGYTNCPDVCPLHLANIGAVMKKLPPTAANRIKVVFVTTDPERDTPERVRAWLDNFHRDFIGLVGDLEEVNRIQESFGIGSSYREELPGGGYGVAHAAQVLAFTPDNLAHVAYPFGIRQVDWAHDLPLLVAEGAAAAVAPVLDSSP